MVTVPDREARRFAGIAATLLAVLILCATQALGAGEREIVTVVTQGGGRFPFHVEIADTPASRGRGLMFRERLAEDEGMLFLFDEVERASFWMKNTSLPLDMLFIAADGRIADMHQDAVPHSTRPINSDGPVLAVLEVRAGTVRKLGIRIGDRIEHPAFTPR